MNREELRKEIIRVETALQKTTSRHLHKDYSKYLRRLRKELDFYDRSMKKWQMNRKSI